MSKTYTYDPSEISNSGIHQMRFILGDTAVEGENETCVLCDEEYQSIIDSANKDGKGFGFAKYKCLEAIVMRLAYEVDYSSSGMSVSLSQRYPRWKEMFESEQKKHQMISANHSALGENKLDGGHYFRLGMNDNDRVSAPIYPFRSF